MNPKYTTLIRILDKFRSEAPAAYKTYHPPEDDIEKLNQARAKAFIHLYLMVKCGITDFEERQALISDGTYDGGLDAYHIDTENKRIRLIQSKFRPIEKNFEDKSIEAEELVKMEVAAIMKGEEHDSGGHTFNAKVLAFQKAMQSIGDIARYRLVVVILANVTKFNEKQIKQLIDHSAFEIVDFNRTYEELVFPLCSGTYYDPAEISIQISLTKKEQSKLSQEIDSEAGHCHITVIFVPTAEIGRVLHKYKNAMLKHNPRSYLSLSKNQVNKRIAESITSIQTNDFAILNNGITVLADNVSITEATGKANTGQIMLFNPQIINGGQTAFTLSQLYSQGNLEMFRGKEVMLKIITLEADEQHRTEFVSKVSTATNLQSQVKSADRASNSETLIKIQQMIYSEHGYFFERKQGEFFDGLSQDFVDEAIVIDRDKLLKSLVAYAGEASHARSKPESFLFSDIQLAKVIPDYTVYKKAYFAYRVFSQLKGLSHEFRKRKGRSATLPNAFRYGSYAVVTAAGIINPSIPNSRDEIEQLARGTAKAIVKKWNTFEKVAKKVPANSEYFARGSTSYANYYKGTTVDADLKAFFAQYGQTI